MSGTGNSAQLRSEIEQRRLRLQQLRQSASGTGTGSAQSSRSTSHNVSRDATLTTQEEPARTATPSTNPVMPSSKPPLPPTPHSTPPTPALGTTTDATGRCTSCLHEERRVKLYGLCMFELQQRRTIVDMESDEFLRILDVTHRIGQTLTQLYKAQDAVSPQRRSRGAARGAVSTEDLHAVQRENRELELAIEAVQKASAVASARDAAAAGATARSDDELRAEYNRLKTELTQIEAEKLTLFRSVPMYERMMSESLRAMDELRQSIPTQREEHQRKFRRSIQDLVAEHEKEITALKEAVGKAKASAAKVAKKAVAKSGRARVVEQECAAAKAMVSLELSEVSSMREATHVSLRQELDAVRTELDRQEVHHKREIAALLDEVDAATRDVQLLDRDAQQMSFTLSAGAGGVGGTTPAAARSLFASSATRL